MHSMQHQLLLSAVLALAKLSGAVAEAVEPTPNPLNIFIGAANTAVGIISSANALASPTSTPTPPPATSSSAAPAPHKSNNHTALIITIVCCVVGSLLLIAAILTGVFCCLARRRRRRTQAQHIIPVDDSEKTAYRPVSPLGNPGRAYVPLRPQNRVPSMEQQPTVPVLAATRKPTFQRSIHRAENPFVPVPPSPRRSNHLSGLTDTTIQEPYRTTPISATRPEFQSLRNSSTPSRSSSSILPAPSHITTSPHPFGLSGIGRPYEDMHVHVLQTEAPSQDLRNSLRDRGLIQNRHNTPPLVPSRSPARLSASGNLLNNASTADSSYHSASEGTGSTPSSGSGEEWRRSQAPQWERGQHRYSDTGTVLAAPPVPWGEPERRRSSPRTSIGNNNAMISGGGIVNWIGGHERRPSRSPAASISGQSKRLRFSDSPTERNSRVGGGLGNQERWDEQQRHSQGVGEAL